MTISSPSHLLPEDARGFLARCGLADRDLQVFAADASRRQYTRLIGRDVVLMDDRHDPSGFAAYLKVSAHLNDMGLSAPRVLHAEPEPGLALLEDFGDDTYARCLGSGINEEHLYALAVDALLHLHHHPKGPAIERPLYDMVVHLDELTIFSRWYAPAMRPDLDIAAFDKAWRALWSAALRPVADRHETLVLRDFHIDNLMLLPGREGVRACGLLDFQDAILGPCEYDLVSLLQDARRDIDPELEERLFQRYCAAAPDMLGDVEQIRQRYALLGAQRHARILGVFVRLHQRDGKSRYLPFMPRVLTQFEQALAAAGLDEISGFLDDTLRDWRDLAKISDIAAG